MVIIETFAAGRAPPPSTDHQAARDQDRQVMRDFWLHSVKGSIMRFVYKPRE